MSKYYAEVELKSLVTFEFTDQDLEDMEYPLERDGTRNLEAAAIYLVQSDFCGPDPFSDYETYEASVMDSD